MSFPQGDVVPLPSSPPRRKEVLAWGLAFLAITVWWVAEWKLSGGSSGTASLTSFRNFIGTSMLVHEEHREKGWHAPKWAATILEIETIPEDTWEYYQTAERDGMDSLAFQRDLALVCWRFSLDWGEDAALWKARAEAALAKFPITGDEPAPACFIPHVIKGTKLSEAEVDRWKEYARSQWPDWWVAFLARQLDQEDTVDLEAVRLQQSEAMERLKLACVMIVGLGVLGLATLPFTWRLLSRPQPPLSASQGCLFRLWSAPRMVAVFGLIELMCIGFHQLFGLVLYPFAVSLISMSQDPYTVWLATIGIWIVWAVAMVLLPLVLFCRLYAPRFFRLRKVQGFTSADLVSPRYLGLFFAGMGIMPWVFDYLEKGLVAVGMESNVLDGLSRSFSSTGFLALPLSLFWGCFIAPLVEETLFRGFIFRAAQTRWGTLPGMLLSSFLFAGCHFYSLMGSIHVFLYGLIFAWVYQRTGKLAASMVLHGATNLSLGLLTHLSGG